MIVVHTTPKATVTVEGAGVLGATKTISNKRGVARISVTPRKSGVLGVKVDRHLVKRVGVLVPGRPGTSSRASSAAVLLPLAAVILVAGCGGGRGGGSAAEPAATHAATPPPAKMRAAAFPQAGVILRETVVVRSAPRRSAREVKALRQFRADNRPTIVFAIGSTDDPGGGS